MARKNYRLREGSIAWYCNKYWKPATAVLLSAALLTAITACTTEKTEKQAEVQEPRKTTSQAEFEPIKVLADVPLDADLQLHIFEVAEQYGLEPELVMAVIGQESNYRHCLTGDNGESYGLMQVMKSQHEERMDKLECTNLLNPYENVTVGVDYLAECIEKGGLEWGLMAYNGGFKYANEMTKQGVVSEYAEGVMMLTDLLKGEK